MFSKRKGVGVGVCRYSVQFNGFTLPVSKPCVLFSSHSPDEDSSQKFIPFIGVCVHVQRCFIVYMFYCCIWLRVCLFHLVFRWWKWGLLNKLLPHLVSYTVNILYIKHILYLYNRIAAYLLYIKLIYISAVTLYLAVICLTVRWFLKVCVCACLCGLWGHKFV